MEQTNSCQRGGGSWDWMKEGEGLGQRTDMHHPTVFQWPKGRGLGVGGGAWAKGGKWGHL